MQTSLPANPIAPTTSAPDDEHWTLVIEPRGSLFDLKLRELWQYRDLIALFVRRDFVAQYKQTILGPAWHFISPLLTTVVFTIVFGKIAKIPTDGMPPFLFYMSGNVLWGYFAAILAGTSSTFTSNSGLFSKVYFPRLAVPVSQLISRLIAFSIQFTFFLGFLTWFAWNGAPVSVNAWVLATPLLLLMLASLGLGVGVIFSALTTKYRDLSILIGYGVQLFMYATPIIYPISVLPEEYRHLALLNPVAPIIELFRYAFLGTGTLDLTMLGLASVTISFFLMIGIMLFNKVERTFIDTV